MGEFWIFGEKTVGWHWVGLPSGDRRTIYGTAEDAEIAEGEISARAALRFWSAEIHFRFALPPALPETHQPGGRFILWTTKDTKTENGPYSSAFSAASAVK